MSGRFLKKVLSFLKKSRRKNPIKPHLVKREVMDVTYKESISAIFGLVSFVYRAIGGLYFAIIIIYNVVEALLGIVVSYLTAEVINVLVYSAPSGLLDPALVKLFAVIAGISFFNYFINDSRFGLWDLLLEKIYRKIDAYISLSWFNILHSTPPVVIEHPEFTKAYQRVGKRIRDPKYIFTQIEEILWQLRNIIRAILLVSVFLGYGYWQLVVFPLLASVFYGYIWQKIVVIRNKAADRLREASRALGWVLWDAKDIYTYFKLRALGIFSLIIDKFSFGDNIHWDSYIDTTIELAKKYFVVGRLFYWLTEVGLFIFLVKQALLGKLKYGTLMFLDRNVGSFMASVSAFITSANYVFSESYYILLILKLLNGEVSKVLFDEIVKNQGVKKIKRLYVVSVRSLQGVNIQIERLRFKYPQSKSLVLKDIDMHIPYGKNVAIVGDNGAGKSTLIKLILGLYPTYNGTIKVGKYQPYEYIPEDYLSCFSILPQDIPQLPYLSAAQLIALDSLKSKRLKSLELEQFYFSSFFKSKKEYKVYIRKLLKGEVKDLYYDVILPTIMKQYKINKKRLKNAVLKAKLFDNVKSWPKGLDTMLSPTFKNGVSPSTGQWQKLNIARILYAPRDILILDEPTSAIDPHSALEIIDTIFDTFKKQTVIIVSHRYSTILNADYIYVLKDGEIIEQGTAKKLLDKKGYFYKAYNNELERLKKVK